MNNARLSEDERMKREGRVVITLIERTMAYNQRRVDRHPSELTREEAYRGLSEGSKQ